MTYELLIWFMLAVNECHFVLGSQDPELLQSLLLPFPFNFMSCSMYYQKKKKSYFWIKLPVYIACRKINLNFMGLEYVEAMRCWRKGIGWGVTKLYFQFQFYYGQLQFICFRLLYRQGEDSHSREHIQISWVAFKTIH